jgi:hypothetical protein
MEMRDGKVIREKGGKLTKVYITREETLRSIFNRELHNKITK